MYCVNCGAEVEQGNKFCRSCGKPIDKEKAEEKSPSGIYEVSEEKEMPVKKKNSFNKMYLYAAAAVVFIVFAFFIGSTFLTDGLPLKSETGFTAGATEAAKNDASAKENTYNAKEEIFEHKPERESQKRPESERKTTRSEPKETFADKNNRNDKKPSKEDRAEYYNNTRPEREGETTSEQAVTRETTSEASTTQLPADPEGYEDFASGEADYYNREDYYLAKSTVKEINDQYGVLYYVKEYDSDGNILYDGKLSKNKTELSYEKYEFENGRIVYFESMDEKDKGKCFSLNFTYDASGLKAQSDACYTDAEETEYKYVNTGKLEYDNSGRLVYKRLVREKHKERMNGSFGMIAEETSYSYDGNGNLNKVEKRVKSNNTEYVYTDFYEYSGTELEKLIKEYLRISDDDHVSSSQKITYEDGKIISVENYLEGGLSDRSFLRKKTDDVYEYTFSYDFSSSDKTDCYIIYDENSNIVSINGINPLTSGRTKQDMTYEYKVID